MERGRLAYAGYVIFFVVLVGSVFAVPFLAFSSDMGAAYQAFSYTCHQKLSRSLCLFGGPDGYWIADCTAQEGAFVTGSEDRTAVKVVADSVTGYKMPVCSRDVGLYGAMLLGGLIYPFVRRLEDGAMYPAIFLVLAIVPLGIDGSLQLVSELGVLPFIYESTNLMRVATGAIAGFVAAFYAIPVLVNIVRPDVAGAAARPKRKNQ
jgi:uncharacterized membrane protein